MGYMCVAIRLDMYGLTRPCMLDGFSSHWVCHTLLQDGPSRKALAYVAPTPGLL
jgi:hypothetical protein